MLPKKELGFGQMESQVYTNTGVNISLTTIGMINTALVWLFLDGMASGTTTVAIECKIMFAREKVIAKKYISICAERCSEAKLK